MLIGYRRRENLLAFAKWLGDLGDEHERMALELQAVATPTSRRIAAELMKIDEQAREHRRDALLLALPDGAVEYRGDDLDAIPIQRNGITLVVPGETPCDVLDAMFEIAAALECGAIDQHVTLAALVREVKEAAADAEEDRS
jgi:hypothetical protein